MKPFIFIFVPNQASRADFEAALRKYSGVAEIIDLPPREPKPAKSAEDLPLWQWFVSSV
jgi:hypothetical protein